MPLPGLDPDCVYEVTATETPHTPIEDVAGATGSSGLPWASGVRMTGRMLEEVGVQAPALPVDELVLIRAKAV